MKKFNEKVLLAASRFLDRKGYDILEEKWQAPEGDAGFDIICKDEDALVFVTARGRDAREKGFSFAEDGLDREACESGALQYLAEHPEQADCQVRFDVIALTCISDSRAMIRHHINALSVCDLSEE